MTVICEHCGYENHMESTKCDECGQPFKKDEAYVVCGTCGISNPKSAKTCIGCQEPLNNKSTFEIEDEIKDPSLEEEVLSLNAAGVVTPEVEVEKKEKFAIKKYFKYLLGVLGLVLLVSLTVFWLMGQKIYLEAENGFYYVTQTGILHVVDENGKDSEIAFDISSDPEVFKYGKNVYYLMDGKLFLYNSNESKLLAENVNSLKIHPNGKEVLYTVALDQDGLGDLYKYDGKETLRIDGHVGVSRYIFNDDDVYYVTDITDDENLGVMYMKRGNKSPVMIAEDVYEPILSIKKDTVYFVRKDVDLEHRFDLYYVKSNKVTEISRNNVQLIIDPNDETFISVQEKNSRINLLSIYRDQVETLEEGITRIGVNSYNGFKSSLHYMDDIYFFVQDQNGMNKFYNEALKEIGIFDDFWLSKDEKKIYTVLNSELSYSDFKGEIENTISLARDASVLTIADSGETSVYEKDGLKQLMTNSYVKTLNEKVSETLISDNEKYLVYLEGTDAYVLKSGAKEPVFLGGQVDDILTLNSYVYTFVSDELYRYKLGKFSSNKAINTIRTWNELKLSK